MPNKHFFTVQRSDEALAQMKAHKDLQRKIAIKEMKLDNELEQAARKSFINEINTCSYNRLQGLIDSAYEAEARAYSDEYAQKVSDDIDFMNEVMEKRFPLD